MSKTINNKKIFSDLIKAKDFTKTYPNNDGFKNRLEKTIHQMYKQRKITYEQYQILKN